MDQSERDQLRGMIIQTFKESLRGGLQPQTFVDSDDLSREQDTLLRALPQTPDNAKWNVIRRLGEIGDFGVMPVLTSLLAHTRPDLRQEAREAIGEVEQRMGSRWTPPPARATAVPPPPPPNVAPAYKPPLVQSTPPARRVTSPSAQQPSPPAPPRASRPKQVKQSAPRSTSQLASGAQNQASEAPTTSSTPESRTAARAAIRQMMATTVVTPYRPQPVAGLPDLPSIGELAEIGPLHMSIPDLPPLADLPPATSTPPSPA